jgi:hypothetical protein
MTVRPAAGQPRFTRMSKSHPVPGRIAKIIDGAPRPALVFADQTVLPRGDGSFVVQPGKPKAKLTPDEFAKFLGVSGITIRRYIHDGTIAPEFVSARGKSRFWNHDDPPTKFDASCRHLLAHHRIPVELKIGESRTGLISFQVRGERFRYCDAQTGARLGQKLIAWFNPEAPESCTFTDLNLRNAFTVARLQSTNGLVADEALAAGNEQVHSALDYAKARYRVLKASFGQTFRQNVASGRTVELGAHIDEATEMHQHRLQAAQKRAKHPSAAAVGR